MYTYNSGYNYLDSGIDFTDSVPFVLAWRVNSSGILRVNMNGTVVNPAGTAVNPATKTNSILLNRWSAGDNIGHEYIVTADAVSDAVMDKAVAALMGKWGISA